MYLLEDYHYLNILPRCGHFTVRLSKCLNVNVSMFIWLLPVVPFFIFYSAASTIQDITGTSFGSLNYYTLFTIV